jgi:dTDP-L-rhamnose 4-epimerase
MTVLVTGGAGFIGSHIVDGLLERGYKVRVFDNLDAQVHGAEQNKPPYLNPEAEFVLKRALDGVQAVFHQAAVVGVGQSMYEVHRYMDHNTLGTANLLDILVNERLEIAKLIVASSMSIYGEGKYQCKKCGIVFPELRSDAQLQEHRWEMRCPNCLEELQPLATDEEKPLSPTSIYAISKRDQEEMCLSIGRAYGVPTVALRYFNTYGPRQALSNPYTGVAAIFSARILNGNPPLIFEDGLQSRDFVHVKDIVRANLLALENPEADYEVFNVGTGRPFTILNLANTLLDRLGRSDMKPKIVQRFRTGDIRHCLADIAKIQKIDYTPQISLEEGISDLIQWVTKQSGALDQVSLAVEHLERRGLVT